MHTPKRLQFFCLAGLMAGVVCGCGVGGLPRSPMQEVPVTGTVTFDGKPLAGAEVVFTMPSLAAFTAVTQEDGGYHLSNSFGGEPICRGLCRVTISKIALPGGVQPQPNVSPQLQGGKESLPAQYSHREQTRLSADVPEAGGKFDFTLTSQ